jgi:hypothetical protein
MLPRPRITIFLFVVVAAAAGFALLRPKTPPAEAGRSSPGLVPTSARDGVADTVADRQPSHPAGTPDLSRWDALGKIHDPSARRRRLMDLLAGLRPQDFDQAAKKLGELGLSANSEEMQLLVSAWCNADIHTAGAFVVSGGVPELIAVVAEDWGKRNYDAAAAWALAIDPPGGTRDYALSRLILPSVPQDPGRALATILRAGKTDRIGEQVTAAIMSKCPGVILG